VLVGVSERVRRGVRWASMDERQSSLNQRLGVTEKALGRAYRVDRLWYARLFESYSRLQRQATDADADADLSRAWTEIEPPGWRAADRVPSVTHRE
jgi:hypothetical protein